MSRCVTDPQESAAQLLMEAPMRISVPTLAIMASVVMSPMPALAQCNTNCAVGAYGTGGISSDGQAQGFLVTGPGRLDGYTFRNVGTDEAGRIVYYYYDDLFGFWDGTLRGDLCIGNSEGLRYGEFTGQADCL